MLLAAALAAGQPVSVLAATPVTHVTATVAMAAPGTNLLLNPEATVGATSAHGWDAVAIPGWQVLGGLSAVVRYGTPGFPETAKAWPANRGSSRAQAGKFSPPSRSGLPGRPSPISA